VRAAERHRVAVPVLRPAAVAALVLPPWPGNVRELANLLERTAILAEGRPVGAGELGLDTAACRAGLDDAAAAALAARLAADELAELARFLGVAPGRLRS
jgi:DNA-binding NtrC family response regulator